MPTSSFVMSLTIFNLISSPGMSDNKNFVSQYIVRVTIAIINIITISLNGIIATKIVKIR